MDFQGLVGTGKTSSLDAIAKRNGYAVHGFPPTSKAASQAARD